MSDSRRRHTSRSHSRSHDRGAGVTQYDNDAPRESRRNHMSRARSQRRDRRTGANEYEDDDREGAFRGHVDPKRDALVVISRVSKPPAKSGIPRYKMTQDLFDSLMLLTTETISSQEFLAYLGIYIPKAPLQKSSTWSTFVKNIEGQKADKLEAGIYPLSVGRGAVHYYGLRKDPDGIYRIANGYPSRAGIKEYSIGLDVQEDHSHGLCQTFALMYLFREEGRLLPAHAYVNATQPKEVVKEQKLQIYRKNIDIGLSWIKDVLLKKMDAGEWAFEGSHEVCERLMCDKITLNEILAILTYPGYATFLDTWFQG